MLNRIASIRQFILASLLVLAVVAFAGIVGLGSPWFGFVASLCVLGFFDLLRPHVRLRLPRFLRPLRPWEHSERVYGSIGVSAFGRLLRRTPLRLLNRRVYLGEVPNDLQTAGKHLEDAEAAHFWGVTATLPYFAYLWSAERWDSLVVVALFDIFVNLYPILHIRSVRARIEHASHRRIGRRSAPV